MHQTQPESNLDNADRRNGRRIAGVIAAGLLTVTIGAMAVLNQPAERAPTSPDLAVSNVAASLPAASSQDPAASGHAARVDAPKPHFERTDEPAVEDSVKPYGG